MHVEECVESEVTVCESKDEYAWWLISPECCMDAKHGHKKKVQKRVDVLEIKLWFLLKNN